MVESHNTSVTFAKRSCEYSHDGIPLLQEVDKYNCFVNIERICILWE